MVSFWDNSKRNSPQESFALISGNICGKYVFKKFYPNYKQY